MKPHDCIVAKRAVKSVFLTIVCSEKRMNLDDLHVDAQSVHGFFRISKNAMEVNPLPTVLAPGLASVGFLNVFLNQLFLKFP